MLEDPAAVGPTAFVPDVSGQGGHVGLVDQMAEERRLRQDFDVEE
jgi:hypothetical protein